MRGLPVKDISVGQMLDGLFAITRDFDMPTQPHLLLLQKTMVMVEGVATALDPDINMWETAEPFVREWIRDELGPEAWVSERRSEEHTSELPSLMRNSYAGLCLKKKKAYTASTLSQHSTVIKKATHLDLQNQNKNAQVPVCAKQFNYTRRRPLLCHSNTQTHHQNLHTQTTLETNDYKTTN